MLFPRFLAYIIFIVASAGASLLFYFLLKKVSQFISVFGFVAGVTAGIMAWSHFAIAVVEYRGDHDVRTRIAIGPGEFDSGDGQKILLKMNGGKDVFIVNETDQPLALQKTHYGSRPDDPDYGPEYIYTHSYLLVRNIPDFYPWENPPEQILINTQTEGESNVRLWLRKATPGEVEGK